MSKVKLAKTAGFCFGVSRALEIAEQAAQTYPKVVTYGPLIHNPDVVSRLASEGVQAVDDFTQIGQNSVVVLRSHGVSKAVMRELEGKNCTVLDATCPFVKKIHILVENYHKKSYNIFIAGDHSHPEVEGILGWCDQSAFVVGSPDEIPDSVREMEHVLLVSQTTFEKEIFRQIRDKLCLLCPHAEVIDTICSATGNRQAEAQSLSQVCDAMVVIGGKNSSNTKRLAQVCKEGCAHVYLVENGKELQGLMPLESSVVGVTAGASTPAYIIKEVVEMLEESQAGTINFEEEMEKTLKPLNTGDIVKGTVIKITPTEVYVGLDSKADGILPVDQITFDPNAKAEDLLQVGQEIEAFVVRVNDMEGYVTLSMRKLETIAGQKNIEEAYENKTNLKGKIAEVVKGGVIVYAFGTKVFIPASLASERYTEDLSTLVGKEVSFKIIDLDRRRRKVVGSVKAAINEEKKAKAEAFWANAQVGQTIQGVVKSLTNFGAFVDIGGVDGLVHITELSWLRIKHPSEVVKPGDVLEVTILDLDRENNKISLGYKKPEDNPWAKAKEMFHVGDVVKCKIVRLLPFGAFAELIPGVDGLIHISQISNKRIGKPADVLKIGEEVEAKIMEIDWEAQKIGLSMRALMEEIVPEKPVNEEPAQAQEEESADYTEDVAPVTLGEVADIPVVEEAEAAQEAPKTDEE